MKFFSCSKVISKEHAVLFNAMQVCTACDCALSITMGQNRPKKEEIRSFKYKSYIWFLELSGLIVLSAPIFIFLFSVGYIKVCI